MDTLIKQKSCPSVQPIYINGVLSDVVVQTSDRTWHMTGRRGPSGEVDQIPFESKDDNVLPVFLGSGLGVGIEQLLSMRRGPVAVVDREETILALTQCKKRFAGDPRVCWVNDDDPMAVLKALTKWQGENRGHKFLPIVHPLYSRLHPEYYRSLQDALKASQSIDFWGQASYRKFSSSSPRILLISSCYFLMGELVAACEHLGISYQYLELGEKERGSTEFVESLLKAVYSFKPDFVLTFNHLGVDREGIILSLLERLQLPLASWFVDNPHLVLSLYEKLATPFTVIFTWDSDTLGSLRSQGYPHVFFLPLATNPKRFHPFQETVAKDHPWLAEISFVGNSMRYKVGARMRAFTYPAELLRAYKRIAQSFSQSSARSVRDFLPEFSPELNAVFVDMTPLERQIGYETLVTWESTRQYRSRCVEQILCFEPLVVGDKGWKITFPKSPYSWRWHRELNYYDELPHFYPLSKINFNCTSMQMKGAVNQRVFDVPACGGFVLTDHREQMEELFEPNKEIIFYRSIEEIKELVCHFLDRPSERARVSREARKRILAQHTYEHRLKTILQTMARIFS